MVSGPGGIFENSVSDIVPSSKILCMYISIKSVFKGKKMIYCPGYNIKGELIYPSPSQNKKRQIPSTLALKKYQIPRNKSNQTYQKPPHEKLQLIIE